jgi:hypothetical protein
MQTAALTPGDVAILIAAAAFGLLAEAAFLAWIVALLTSGIDAAFAALGALVRRMKP